MKQAIVFIIFFSPCSAAFATPTAGEGKVIFTARCASCHNVNKNLVGPALAGVDTRRDINWIVKFVQSSQAVIKSGDKEAVVIFEKCNRTVMPDHADLQTNDIKSLVEFIKSEAKPADAAANEPFRPTKLRPAYTPVSIYNYTFFLGLSTGVLLLVFALLSLVWVKEYQRDMFNHPA